MDCLQELKKEFFEAGAKENNLTLHIFLQRHPEIPVEIRKEFIKTFKLPSQFFLQKFVAAIVTITLLLAAVVLFSNLGISLLSAAPQENSVTDNSDSDRVEPKSDAENNEQSTKIIEKLLILSSLEAHSPSFGELYIDFRFNEQVDASELKKFVTIEPNIDVTIGEDSYYRTTLLGKFEFGKTYNIKINQGLKNNDGYFLKNDIVQKILFPDRAASVRVIKDNGKILNLYGKTQISFETINCQQVKLQLFRIYPNNLVNFLSSSYYYQSFVEKNARLVSEKILDVFGEKNIITTSKINLSEFIELPELSGTYWIRLSKYNKKQLDYYDYDDYYESSQNMLVVLSDLGITIKKQVDDRYLFWITSLSKVKPIIQSKITIWSHKNQSLITAKTNEEGLAIVELPATNIDGTPEFVQVSFENDTNIWRLDDGLWNTNRFDVGGLKTNSKSYKTFIFSPRNIYVPGENAQFSAILRTPDRNVPPIFPVVWTVQRQDGVEILKENTLTTIDGTANISWNIPEEILTGNYDIYLNIPGSIEKLAIYNFNIEDFVPDRFNLDIKVSSDKPYTLQDKIFVTVNCSHLHGAPATKRKINWTAELVPSDFKIFQDKNSSWQSEYVWNNPEAKQETVIELASNDSTTDENGQAKFFVDLPSISKIPAMYNLQIKATLSDVGGRSITRYESVPIYCAKEYLGIQRETKKIILDRPVQFKLVAIDMFGNPKDCENVSVKITKVDWVWSRRDSEDRIVYDYLKKYDLLAEENIFIEKGQAFYSFTPQRYGQYQITLQNKISGLTTSLEFNTWGNSFARNPDSREYLQLKPEKEKYVQGETAQIKIVSPFDGLALVCLEREKVLSTKIIEVTNGESIVSFPIEQLYSPNVYCTATLIRSQLNYNSERLYRVYGAVPIIIDNNKKISIDMEIPDEIRSESSLDTTITLTHQSKPLADALVTLAVVDEGICQLTNFKTPSPFEFFYGKESLQVESYDLYKSLISETPPGGKSMPKTIKQSFGVPSSQKKYNVAFWLPNLRTNENGQVVAHLNFPKFVGKARIMVIAHCKDLFGNKEKFVFVRSPLTVQLNGPRFLSWGDEFYITASMMNYTKAPCNIEFKIDSDIPLVQESNISNLPNPVKLLVDIASSNNICQGKLDFLPEEERFVRFFGIAPFPSENSSNKILCNKIQITCYAGEESSSAILEIPIRPNIFPENTFGIGSLELGKDQCVEIPSSWMSGTGESTLQISTQPLLQFSGSLEYLLEYPYGCVEQTTSRAFPLLYLDSLLALQKERKHAYSSASAYIDVAINRLQLMQTSEGGLSMWPNGVEPHYWGTCYATHFLLEAKNAGYKIPESLWNSLTSWCMSKYNKLGTRPSEIEIRSYSAYILARLGKIGFSELAWFVENSAKLNTVSKSFIAAALFSVGQKSQALRLLEVSKENNNVQDKYFDNFSSETRDQALYLATLLDIDSNSPEIPLIVESLMAKAEQGRWTNTQENAYTLLALGKYVHKLNTVSANGEISVTIKQDDKVIECWTPESSKILQWKQSTPILLTINSTGQGKIFYRWTSSGIPHTKIASSDESKNAVEKLKLLNLEHRILDENGNEIVEGEIPNGNMIWIEYTITGQDYTNLVLEQWLPSGFEVENPRMLYAEKIPHFFDKQKIITPKYFDIRSDRALAFFDLLNYQDKVYLGLRAICPGKFSFPKARIHCMYSPSLQSETFNQIIEVK